MTDESIIHNTEVSLLLQMMSMLKYEYTPAGRKVYDMLFLSIHISSVMIRIVL